MDEWNNIDERVALFEDHDSEEKVVIAFATILTYDPPEEPKGKGKFTIGRIKKLSSAFQVPKKTTKMPDGALYVADRVYGGCSLGRPVRITDEPTHDEYVINFNETCEACCNRKCPFWNRFEGGDRSRFWVQIVTPDGKTELDCPSQMRGKGKSDNAMVNPPGHILKELGLQIHPLNGLSYSKPLHSHRDTLNSARKRYKATPDKLEMFDSALASRGNAQVIQEKWCSTCKKQKSCAILAYLRQEDGQVVHVEDWVYWAEQPVCISHAVKKEKKKPRFIH